MKPGTIEDGVGPDPLFAISGAVPADLRAIVGLIRGLADFERLRHLCVVTEQDLALALFGPRPCAEVLLARSGSEIVGFALFFHNFSTFLGRPGVWLEDLFVVPEHRRRGCGKALLRALARLAVERGCGRFEWAVLDWNAAAIDFYTSLGATLLPDWRIVRAAGAALVAIAAEAPGSADAPPPNPSDSRLLPPDA